MNDMGDRFAIEPKYIVRSHCGALAIDGDSELRPMKNAWRIAVPSADR